MMTEADGIVSDHTKVLKMWLYTLWLYAIISVKSTIGNQLTKISGSPYQCSSTWNIASSAVDLNCFITDNTNWTFQIVQKWAEEHTVENMTVYIKCGQNGSIILRQPVKSHGLAALYIETCKIHQYYRYDLSKDIRLLPFTIKTMEVVESIHVITYQELSKLYSQHSAEVNSLYPCYIPPSLERYVERNVSVTAIRNGYIDHDDRIRHRKRIPTCNYTHLSYYEKSISTRSKLKFVSRFLDKGYFPLIRVLNFTRLHLATIPQKLRGYELSSEHFIKQYYIDLSYNRISQVEFGSFNNTNRNQFTIDLSHNNVRVITPLLISTLEAIYPGVLLFYSNPFSCKCDQHSLIEFLKNSPKTLVLNYKYIYREKCKTPIRYKGHVLSDVPFEKECHPLESNGNDITITVICVVGAVISVFVVIAYLCYNKYFVCLRYKRLTQKRDTISSNNYEYDAFISYSSEDESWVKMMCRRLGGPPYHAKLCLHDHHFVPGVTIADNIFDAVRSSRLTVAVMSEHFLSSQWCMMEFREASYKSMLQTQSRVLVIVLDDLDGLKASLPPDVDLFLKTHTYLRVTEYGFWEKLVNGIVQARKDSDTRTYDNTTEV